MTTPVGGISRRSVLRNAAIGGGLVWAAPVVQSMTTPAFAQDGSPACEDQVCSEVVVGGQVVLRLRCEPVTGNEGCLCACAQVQGFTCPSADPCNVQLYCVPDDTCVL